MLRLLIAFAAVAVLLAGLFACAPLKAFNTLLPHDGGVRRVVTNAAYGPEPRQTLDLYAPAEKGAPVIVFFYGGSWSSGDKRDYSFAADALASCGFVVAVPDYRLVPSVRFPTFLEDAAAAVRWVHDNAAAHGGDPNRIVLAGHSAGAYLAVMLALNAEYLTKAGAPLSAIKGAAGVSGPYDFYPFDVKASIDAFGQAPDPAATQPITYARANAPPLLLTYGDKDVTVKPKNTINLSATLRQLGAPVEVKVYSGVDHITPLLAFSRVFRGKAPVREDVCSFAKRVTGAAAMANP
jgi:acetyl esterase/lipase